MVGELVWHLEGNLDAGIGEWTYVGDAKLMERRALLRTEVNGGHVVSLSAGLLGEERSEWAMPRVSRTQIGRPQISGSEV